MTLIRKNIVKYVFKVYHTSNFTHVKKILETYKIEKKQLNNLINEKQKIIEMKDEKINQILTEMKEEHTKNEARYNVLMNRTFHMNDTLDETKSILTKVKSKIDKK